MQLSLDSDVLESSGKNSQMKNPAEVFALKETIP